MTDVNDEVVEGGESNCDLHSNYGTVYPLIDYNRLKSERRRVSQYTESKDNSEACSKVMHLCTLERLSHLVLQILGHSLTYLRLVHFS